MTNANGLLTLLTDFGWRDVYVGAMKGAIALTNPQLTVIDLTHDIPPQDIGAARFCLMDACPYFPEGTVHVAVVDPGVGSQRRAVALELEKGFLVGPDNGLFSGVLDRSFVRAAVELTNPEYWLSPSGRGRDWKPAPTFHGRDIFAPAGAHLASGVALEKLGAPLDPATLVQFPIEQSIQTSKGFAGCIQYIDRFGNSVTNIPGSSVEGKTCFVAVVASSSVAAGQTYSDVPEGSPLVLVGSHGWVEIAVNGGSARNQLNLRVGSPVEIDIRLE